MELLKYRILKHTVRFSVRGGAKSPKHITNNISVRGDFGRFSFKFLIKTLQLRCQVILAVFATRKIKYYKIGLSKILNSHVPEMVDGRNTVHFSCVQQNRFRRPINFSL